MPSTLSKFPGLTAVAMWLTCLAPGTAFAEPATYSIDRQHTNVSFSWNHLGLSRQSGRILDVEGTLVVDMAKPEEATLEVVMKTASIVTGVTELDRHLKSVDFFEAARNPIITFKSTGIKKTGEKTGEVTGDLMILGITKPVVLQVTLNFDGEHPLAPLNASYRDKFVAGFSARGKLSRSEWGLKRGTPLVSDDIEIVIETELNRK
ncbi:MAG: YceI family protein [Hyphomicrobiaceae bacterium]